MEGMPPDNGYLPPLSSVQIKTAKTQKHLYCLVFTAASCRSQDAHLIVMGCVAFAPASEADVFGNASQAVPGRTLRSRPFFCLSARTQRRGSFCQCIPIESLGTQFAFGAFFGLMTGFIADTYFISTS